MKKILLIVGPLLLVGGGVVAAAMMGMIHIPGLSPEKKKQKAAALYTETKEDPAPVAQKEPEPTPPAAAEAEAAPLDLDKGRKKLARLWNELEPGQILEIAADWKDDDLAKQLRFLDAGKAAEVLALMKPPQASKISKLLQELNAEPAKTES